MGQGLGGLAFPSVVLRRGTCALHVRYLCGIRFVDSVTWEADSRVVGVGVLGPLVVDEGRVRLGSRDRTVLAALAMRSGEVRTPDQLAEALWGEYPPASSVKNLHSCVSRLRKQLGPDASSNGWSGRCSASPGPVVR